MSGSMGQPSRLWVVCDCTYYCYMQSLLLLQIELIDGKWHNLPSLPNFIREFNGMMMGTLPRLTEPLWGWTVEFVGDDYYKMKREGKRGTISSVKQ